MEVMEVMEVIQIATNILACLSTLFISIGAVRLVIMHSFGSRRA
jgi:hypothetical protein